MRPFNITSFLGRALINADIRQMCVYLISPAFEGKALIKEDMTANVRPFNITSFRGKALIKEDMTQMYVHLISRVFSVEH